MLGNKTAHTFKKNVFWQCWNVVIKMEILQKFNQILTFQSGADNLAVFSRKPVLSYACALFARLFCAFGSFAIFKSDKVQDFPSGNSLIALVQRLWLLLHHVVECFCCVYVINKDVVAYTYQVTASRWRSWPAPQAHSLRRRWLRSLSASTCPWIWGLSRWRSWWWAWWCCSGTTRWRLPVVSPRNIPLLHPVSLVCPQVLSRSGPGECKRSQSPSDLLLYQEALWDIQSKVVWHSTTRG